MSIGNKGSIGSQAGILFDRACYVGIVRNNVDPQRMNRIKVWIPELKGHPDQPETWHTISYASMSSSISDINLNKKTTDTYEDSQQSWGWWGCTPEINSEVLVIFANGEPNRGFYFAAPFSQNMNHSIPAYAGNIASNKKESCGGLPPVTEYNRRDENQSVANPPRPVFDPLYNGLCNQGLLSDTERGTGSSSARRESPSKVSGYKSPRGNHIVVDDDPDNEFIRIRTRTGNQILLHATTGYVYICSKMGNSWIEISDEGVDVYSKFSISFHAEKDINLHASENINIHADNKIKIYSGNNTEHFIGKDHITKTVGLDATEANHITEKFLLKETQGLIKDNCDPVPNVVYEKLQNHYYLIKTNNCCGTKTNKNSITSRLPTHEPWPLHPNKNATVKTPTDVAPTYKVKPINTITNRESPVKNTPGENTTNVPQKKEIVTGTGEKIETNKNILSGDKTSIGGRKIPVESKAAIEEAVDRTDTNYGYMMAMAEAESGFDPDAKAKTSSASGLYQFTDGTWKGMVDKYGKETGISLDDKNDPRANAVMAGLYTKENGAYLKKNLGREPTNTDLYMGHFLGANGAKQILTANPNASAAASNPKAAAANKTIFYNKDGSARTNAQVVQIMSNKIEPRAQVYNQSRLVS
jgi:hypothetical protein